MWSQNYRPITLTSIVVKMLENFVSDHIRDHLMTNGLMYTDQHGFSSGKSCASALSEAVCEWNKILDRRSSPTPRIDLVSVDYSRAFDSISHDVLLEKLHRTYGFKGPLLNWISSLISNRHQRVVFRGKCLMLFLFSPVCLRAQCWGPCFSIFMLMTSIFTSAPKFSNKRMILFFFV